jgi:hypothetical protein
MRVFIGSSTESRRLVEWLTAFIRKEFPGKIEPVPWTVYWQGGFSTLEHVERIADETDAAILFFTADDKTWYRDTARHEPRDNLIFEAGLFFAAHDRFRTQILVPNYQEDDKKKAVSIPTDLRGMTLNYFDWVNGDPAATGLPNAAWNVCNHLVSLGTRVRLPAELEVLARHPEIQEVRTFVGPFPTILNDGVVRLSQDPNLKEADVLVAYRMGEVARNFRATCDRPDVRIRLCFADMWDDALVAAYQRKYADRTGEYIRNAVKESIERVLGACDFDADAQGVLQAIKPKQPPKAHYEIRLTPQRITYSFYRTGDVCFVVPLDMKQAQDPAPLAWAVARATSPRVYEHYLSEYQHLFDEARRVL